MPPTAEKVIETLKLQTAIAICALASLKQERGTFLIKRGQDIERDLRRLVDENLIERTGGLYGNNVTDLLYCGSQFGCGHISEDKYDQNKLEVDKKTILFFQELIVGSLRFGSQELFAQIFSIANFLEAPNVPIEAAKRIIDRLQEFDWNFLKDKCSQDSAYRRILAVLIPLACISAYDTLGIYSGTPDLVIKHQTGCRYCKEYLALLQVHFES